jgi:hypothetical protein
MRHKEIKRERERDRERDRDQAAVTDEHVVDKRLDLRKDNQVRHDTSVHNTSGI